MQEIYKTDKISIVSSSIGMLGNNVFVLKTKDEQVIVDPACNPDEIMTMVEDIPVTKILITHYHWDHVRACADIQRATKAKTYASKLDAPYIEDPEKAPLYRKTEPCKIDNIVFDGDKISIGETSWKVIETPGHTMGCICFYSENCGGDPVLICGDTLFKTSHGRVDFVDSDPKKMQESLSKLAKLPDETIVLPGHESFTTIGNERNYMLKGL